MINFPDIKPEIFTISIWGLELTLRWYALSYIIGFVFAIYIMKYCIRKKHLWNNQDPPLDENQADSLLTYLILGVIIGGRLGYVIFYNPAYYYSNIEKIIRVWDGGMSFHGGFLGVIFAVIFYCQRNNIKLWSCSDLIALASPPGLFLGRIANFINAELWGRPTEMPWGIIFPGDAALGCPEIGHTCARHPSQLYEATLEGLILFLLLVAIVRSGALSRPGFTTGVFAVGYGLSRFFVEYFRVPDPQFFSPDNPYGFALEFASVGMTMGQVLTLPMIIVGVCVLVMTSHNSRAQKDIS